MKVLQAILAAGVCFAAAAHGGPYGMEMGMSLGEVSKLGALAPSKSRHVYTLQPASDDGAYQLYITPVFGLCKIVAVGPALDVRADGEALRSAFERHAGELNGVYGPYRKSDGLGPDGGSGWMSDLAQERRVLYAYWQGSPSERMKDNLQAIKLEANGLSAERGYLSVAYEFRNFGDCLAEDAESARAGLPK